MGMYNVYCSDQFHKMSASVKGDFRQIMNHLPPLPIWNQSIVKRMIPKPGLSLFRSSRLGLLPVIWVISLKTSSEKEPLGTVESLQIESLVDPKGKEPFIIYIRVPSSILGSHTLNLSL